MGRTPDPVGEELNLANLGLNPSGVGAISNNANAFKAYDSVGVFNLRPTAHADGSVVVNASTTTVQVGVLATDAQHGDRGGGSLHAVAVASGAAGFLSGADKAKLDSLSAATPTLQQVYDAGHSVTLNASDAFVLNMNNIGGASAQVAMSFQNNTGSTVGVPLQMAPSLNWYGSAWNGTETKVQQTLLLMDAVEIGTTNVSSQISFYGNTNAGGATRHWSLNSYSKAFYFWNSGTAELPILANSSSPTTGLYFPAANQIGLSIAGANTFNLSSGGASLSQVPLYITRDGGGGGYAEGMRLRNTTAATVGTLYQVAPTLIWEGAGWNGTESKKVYHGFYFGMSRANTTNVATTYSLYGNTDGGSFTAGWHFDYYRGALYFAKAGTASAPVIADNAAPTSGMYFPTANEIGFSNANQATMTLNASNEVGIGGAPTTGNKLHVTGITRTTDLKVNTNALTDNSKTYNAVVYYSKTNSDDGGFMVSSNQAADGGGALLAVVNYNSKISGGVYSKPSLYIAQTAGASISSTQTASGTMVVHTSTIVANLTTITQNIYSHTLAINNTSGEMIGTQTYAYVQGSGPGSPGRLNDFTAYRSRGQFATADSYITTHKDFHAGAYVGIANGAVTTRYGLLIDFPDTNITNPWGVYQTEAAVKNRFAGQTNLDTGLQFANSSFAVSDANTGRLRYTTSGQTHEVSHNGAAYVAILTTSNGVVSTRTLTAGAGMTGGGDLSADRTFDVIANADASIVVNANDIQVGVLASDAQHGVRGGGTQHAVVIAAGAAGFMSGADKTKLDGIATGATAVTITNSAPANVTKAAASAGASSEVARADHKHDITTAAPGATGVATASAEGSATTLARSDHAHISNTAPSNVTSAAAAIGTSAQPARADHKHDITVAAPGATGVATSSGAGAATSLARSDHTHQSNTAPTNTTKAAAAIGTSGQPARADHKHDITTATAVAVGATSAEGSSTSIARADHTHAVTDLSITSQAHGDILYRNATNWVRLAAGTSGQFLKTVGINNNPIWDTPAAGASVTNTAPANVTKAAAAVGVATDAARADHKHDITTAAGVAVGTANAEGSSTSLARADHTHQVTGLSIASEAQGDILYRNASAWVRLPAGTSGYFLKTLGAAANPVWDVPAAGVSLTNTAPANVTKAAAAVGVSGEAARADHKHDITTAAASSIGATNAEGSATSLARSDHTHAVTDLSITSQAHGDMLYRNASNWVRLAAGTSGYYLKAQGAAIPVWTVAPFGTLDDSYDYLGPGAGRTIQVTDGAVELVQDSIGATLATNLKILNKAAAANNAQQFSPALHFGGLGWSTGAGVSRSVDFYIQGKPQQGGSDPSGKLEFSRQINGGTVTAMGSFEWDGTSHNLIVQGNMLATGDIDAAGGFRKHTQLGEVAALSSTTYYMRWLNVAGNQAHTWIYVPKGASIIRMAAWTHAALSGLQTIVMSLKLASSYASAAAGTFTIDPTGGAVTCTIPNSGGFATTSVWAKDDRVIPSGYWIRIIASTTGSGWTSKNLGCMLEWEY